jgi:DNA-binding MarR family transcriptional regulator
MSLLVARRDEMFSLLRAHDLTPPHGHALQLLSDGPLRMRDIAEHAMCDASYVTALVDRLEASGLVIRRESPTDRRVREIALTPKGRRLAKEVDEVFSHAPAELRRLSADQRAQFVELMGIVAPGEPERGGLFRPPRV